MIKEPSNKDNEVRCVINNLKACLKKLDSIKETSPYDLIGIAIPGDKDVISSIYSVIKTAIGFKQSELDNQDTRIPAGSDYDLDKSKPKIKVIDVPDSEFIDKDNPMRNFNWTPGSSLATLREIVHNGVFNGRSFESICCELIALHEAKNKDYGGAFDKSMNKFGVVSLLIRLNDKFERLESLFKNGKAEVTDESFEDTLRDIACYAIMGLEHLYNTPKQ